MSETIAGKLYSTAKAKILAAGPRVDGPREEFGNTFLFRGPGGEYFATHDGFLDRRRDRLEPLTWDQAITLWARLPQKLASFDAAFPDPRESSEMLKKAA